MSLFSLIDWVMDLQYLPQPLDKVGDLCGFDGNGHHCHKVRNSQLYDMQITSFAHECFISQILSYKGVLTRCKWMYNDIKK